MSRETFVHKKYPAYKSLLVPILSWGEIENNIINNYHKPSRYTKTIERTKIDDLIEPQVNNYKNVDKIDLENTLKFLYDNYKEFLFFSIRNNKINAKYHIYNRELVNKWNKNLSVAEGRNFGEFFSIAKKKVRGLQLNFIPPDKWYANNCLIRMENWGDKYGMPISYLEEILEVFEFMMKKYDLPDCDFIVNRKDFALLTTNKSYAYYSLYDEKDKSNQPDNCWFVCSQSRRKETLDIVIPTSDEWKFLSNIDKLKDVTFDWYKKIPTAIWRGSTTGCGVKPETNKRIKMAEISKNINRNDKKSIDGYPYINAGIVQFTKGFKVTNKVINFIDQQKLNIPKLEFVTYEQQSTYKYVLNIEGNSGAYRYSSLFYTNSTVVNVKTKFKLWFEPLLEKNKEFIQLSSKLDENNVIKTLEFLKTHDDVAKYIADNGKKFFETYINKDTISEYWYKLMIEFNKKQL